MTHNEQMLHKILTTGRVRRSKSHPDGVLSKDQHRSWRLMLWQLEVLEAVFAAAGNADVKLHAKKCRAIIEAAVERRKKWVSEFEVMKRAFLRGDAAAGSTMAGSTVDKWPVDQASLRSVWSPEAGLTNELDANEEFQPPPADAIPFPFDRCHPSSADDDSLRTAVEGAAGADDAGELVAQGSPEAEALAIQGNDDAAMRDRRTGAPNATTGANRCPDNSQLRLCSQAQRAWRAGLLQRRGAEEEAVQDVAEAHATLGNEAGRVHKVRQHLWFGLTEPLTQGKTHGLSRTQTSPHSVTDS